MGAAGAAPAQAQLAAELELGGSRISQPSFPGRDAATAQARLRWDRSWLALQGATALTQPTSGAPRTFGVLGATLRAAASHGVIGELSGVGSVYDDGTFPTALSGHLQGRLRGAAAGTALWTGASLGSLDDGRYTYPLATVDAGASRTMRGTRATLLAAYVHTQGEPRTEFEGGMPLLVERRDRIAYTDATVQLDRAVRRVELTMRGGARIVHRTLAFVDRDPRAFGSLDAAWWVTPHLAVTAAAGRDLADLARGLPDTRYLTLALRARLPHAASRGRAAGPLPRATATAPDAVAQVIVERGASAGTTLVVTTGTGVSRVELAGTFTAWEPVLLTRDATGAWRFAGDLPAGPHRLMVRVDGGAWQAPANLPALEDELGRVGVVTIP